MSPILLRQYNYWAYAKINGKWMFNCSEIEDYLLGYIEQRSHDGLQHVGWRT